MSPVSVIHRRSSTLEAMGRMTRTTAPESLLGTNCYKLYTCPSNTGTASTNPSATQFWLMAYIVVRDTSSDSV